jgi:hypothetical protein
MDVTNAAVVLLDDLDNPAGTRFDQNRATVHNRVTIIPNAIFRWHIVVGDALVRQNRANSSRKAQSAACVEIKRGLRNRRDPESDTGQRCKRHESDHVDIGQVFHPLGRRVPQPYPDQRQIGLARASMSGERIRMTAYVGRDALSA